MRFVEFCQNIWLSLSNEEHAVWKKIKDHPDQHVFDEDLDERSAELARKLVSRGGLQRNKIDDKTVYTANHKQHRDEL